MFTLDVTENANLALSNNQRSENGTEIIEDRDQEDNFVEDQYSDTSSKDHSFVESGSEKAYSSEDEDENSILKDEMNAGYQSETSGFYNKSTAHS